MKSSLTTWAWKFVSCFCKPSKAQRVASSGRAVEQERVHRRSARGRAKTSEYTLEGDPRPHTKGCEGRERDSRRGDTLQHECDA